MMIISREIGAEELGDARVFFSSAKLNELKAISEKFQKEQPLIASFGYALRRNGIDPYAIQILVQSVCEVYYVVRVLRAGTVKKIDVFDVHRCVEELSSLSERYHNLKSPMDALADLSEFSYYDSISMGEHALDSLSRAFGDLNSVLAQGENSIHFRALLRAIETADWSTED